VPSFTVSTARDKPWGADSRQNWRQTHGSFAIILFALIAAAPAAAAIFPSRPVTMMVGFPPGGPTDTLARIIADAMQGPLGGLANPAVQQRLETLGWPIIRAAGAE
jgi:hypothetical protein